MENEPIIVLAPLTDVNILCGCSGGVGSFGGTAVK